MEDLAKHHIWCNYFMKPAKGCKMCDGLREKYPENNLTPDELIKKHFPITDAVEILTRDFIKRYGHKPEEITTKEIRCYICEGVFWINESYRTVNYQILKRKKHFVAANWVRKKTKMGIVCPYCHSHLLEKPLKDRVA